MVTTAQGMVTSALLFGLVFGSVQAAQGMPLEIYSFTIVADTAAPYLAAAVPGNRQLNAARTASIQVLLADDASGIDRHSLSLSVNGRTIIAQGQIQPEPGDSNQAQLCRVETAQPTDNELLVVYQPRAMFSYAEPVTVSLQAADVAGNIMDEVRYDFNIQNYLGGSTRTRLKTTGTHQQAMLAALKQTNPSVITTEQGKKVFLAWEERQHAGSRVYVSCSVDYGVSFAEPVALRAPEYGEQSAPALAGGSDGTVYLVWQERRPGARWQIYAATMATEQLAVNEARLVADDAGHSDQVQPALAVWDELSVTGNLRPVVSVVWRDEAANAIKFSRSSSVEPYDALIFNPVVARVDDASSGATAVFPQIAVTPAGGAVVCWLSNGVEEICVVWDAANGSGMFGSDQHISGAAAVAPRLAPGSNNSEMMLLWARQSSDAELLLSRLSLPAAALTTSTAITSVPSAELGTVALAADRQGNGYVLWSAQDNGVQQVVLSAAHVGQTQAQEYQRFGNGLTQQQPALAMDPEAHHFYSIWSEVEGGESFITVCRNSGLAVEELLGAEISCVSGGSVVAADGVLRGSAVYIPAAAIDACLEVSFTRVIAPPPVPEQLRLISAAVDFCPGGTRFAAPVTITVPFDALALATDDLLSAIGIYHYNLSAGRWEAVPDSVVDTAAQTVSAAVSHFSMYAVGIVNTMSVPADDNNTPPVSPTPASPNQPHVVPGREPAASDSRGEGCFIATAAYGTELAPQVNLLRRFRDRCLLTSAGGRHFVRWYYALSPKPAAQLARHEPLRAMARLCLRPLLAVSSWLCAAE